MGYESLSEELAKNLKKKKNKVNPLTNKPYLRALPEADQSVVLLNDQKYTLSGVISGEAKSLNYLFFCINEIDAVEFILTGELQTGNYTILPHGLCAVVCYFESHSHFQNASSPLNIKSQLDLLQKPETNDLRGVEHQRVLSESGICKTRRRCDLLKASNLRQKSAAEKYANFMMYIFNMSLPVLHAPYLDSNGEEGNPLEDFDEFKKLDSSRDDVPLHYLGIFYLFFIIQTVIFVVLAYGLKIGFFDETFFRPKCKIPFFSQLYQEIEQEYEKPASDESPFTKTE